MSPQTRVLSQHSSALFCEVPPIICLVPQQQPTAITLSFRGLRHPNSYSNCFLILTIVPCVLSITAQFHLAASYSALPSIALSESLRSTFSYS